MYIYLYVETPGVTSKQEHRASIATVTYGGVASLYIPDRCSKSYFKSSTPSAAYVRQWIVSALVQIMGCLFGAESLSKPILCYC